MRRLRHIVVVGASLAGLRTAEALREQGFAGRLTIIGDEPHPPYDRPPLSKRFLTQAVTGQELELAVRPGLDADWRLGAAAVRLDVRNRTVTLADGSDTEYEGLVIATGVSARRRPGFAVLRGLADAVALRGALHRARADGGRLLVVGAGVLGSEVAAGAKALGLAVTLVGTSAQPMGSALGPVAGAMVAEAHRAAGVDLRLSTSVTDFTGGRARLSDGSTVRAAVGVIAVGAEPNTGWLAGSGLWVEDGLVCDEFCRVLLADGTPAPGIVAAGDVVRAPHPLAGGASVRVEHWHNAVDQAATAARTVVHGPEVPHSAVPSSWSDQYDLRIRAVGLPSLATEHRVLDHDPVRRRLEVACYRHGRQIGAVVVNRPSRLPGHRHALTARA